MSRGKLFYGWIIVIGGMLLLGVTHGIVINTFGLFIVPVSQAIGVTREAFSLCQTIVNMLYAVFSFASGVIYRRVPIRLTMRIAAITLPLCYFGYSLCGSLAAMLACSAGVGLSLGFLTFQPFSVILSNWFDEKRGSAIGLCFMGSGLGGMVMSALYSLLLESTGWRATYRVGAIIMLCVAVPMVWLVIRVTPAEKGLKPLGSKAGGASSSVSLTGPSRRDAVRSLSFAALVLFALANGLVCAVYNTCISPHLTDLGFTPLYAGLIVSVYMGSMAAGKLLLGILYDKAGTHRATVISMAAFVIGYLALVFSRSSLMHPLILVGALGVASSNVSFPLLTRYAFGTREYPVINGYLMGCTYVTGSFAAVIANTVFSRAGSYTPILLTCAGLAVMMALLMIFVRQHPQVDQAQ